MLARFVAVALAAETFLVCLEEPSQHAPASCPWEGRILLSLVLCSEWPLSQPIC